MGNCWPKPASPPSSVNKAKGSKPRAPKQGTIYNVAETHNSPTSPLVHDKHLKVQGQPPPPLLGSGINSRTNGEGINMGSTNNQNLRIYTYAELKSATRNFRPDTVLGEGGFGRVFKGWVDAKTYAPSKVGVGIPVAVKKSNPDSEQGLNEWQAEVKFLGKFCHPNLVKLVGYCWDDEELLLVYEYMQRGSLESHLFRRGAETLAWETRLNIAVGAARGLEFLHSTEKQVIYRDFKSSNILLGMDFNAKLSDFGLAKLGPMNGDSHVTTQVVGTYGYAAPEYMATGHLYVKSDVYGFGVVLLEIISGRPVLDLNRPTGEHNLVDWAKPLLPQKRKVRQVMDPRLEGQYPLRAVVRIAELILQCLEPDPKKRPSMDQVLETLQHISTIQIKPKDPHTCKDVHRKPANHPHPNNNYHHHRSPPPPLRSKNPSASALEARPRQKLPVTRSY